MRRSVLGGASVTAPARRLPPPTPHAYRPRTRSSSPVAADRHLVSRFSYGVTPALAKQVRAAGRRADVVREPARPRAIADAASSGLRTRGGPASRTRAAPRAVGPPGARDRGRLGGHGQLRALGSARRIRSHRQVLEIMTRVLGEPPQCPGQRRRRVHLAHGRTGSRSGASALGTLRGACCGAILHPAMVIYLDNACRPRSPRPTRTSAASCSSCTRSAGGNHDEDDVKSSARILTG